MTDSSPPTAAQRASLLSVVVLALAGGVLVWMLAQPAPQTPGLARIRSPEIALAIFDTLWLVVAALARGGRAGTATTLAVGVPFHLAIATAAGASPGFHAAWALAITSFAAVGSVGAHAAPEVHGLGLSLLGFALPLAAYATGEFGGLDTRSWFLASPLVAPTLLARNATNASAGDAVPSLAAAALLFAADLVAGRLRKAPPP